MAGGGKETLWVWEFKDTIVDIGIVTSAHIEAVRYPKGSDAMGFLTTILTDGRPGPQRIALWVKNVAASVLRYPFKTVRVLQPLGWAREFVILLCMQALDGEISMRWQRPGSGRSGSFWSATAKRCQPISRKPTSLRRLLRNSPVVFP